MKTPTKFILGLSVASMALVAGCSTDMSSGADRRGVSDHVAGVEAQIAQDSSRLTRAQATGRPGSIKVNDGLFLGREGFRTNHGDPLPRRFETANGVQMNMGPSITLPMFAQLVHKTTGIRVEYSDLYAQSVAGNGPQEAGGGDGADQADSANDGARSSAQPAFASASSTHPSEVRFYVDHSGPLSALLDYVAGQLNVDWKYSGGRIKFLGPQTVTYTLWAPSMTVGTSGSVGGGSSFGASQSMATNITGAYDYWATIQSGLSAILPDTGARMAINQNSGTVTVTGFQSVHDRVADFVEQENARLSRQVAVKVDILAVSKNSTDTRSTNLNLMLQNASAGLNLAFLTPLNEIEGSSGLSSTIIDADSNLNGSSAMINALAEEGRVALLKSTSVIARNEVSTPISIATEKAYLAGSTTETDENGNESTTLETGIINNGMNLVVTPRIMSNGEVIMSYSMTINDLKNIERYETADSLIQLPEVDTRNFAQTVNMGSGDSLVMAAFDGSRAGRNASGPFSAAFWGVGGSDGFSVEDTRIVVIMTPVVIEKSNAPRVRR